MKFTINEPLFGDFCTIDESSSEAGSATIGRLFLNPDGRHRLTTEKYNLDIVANPGESRDSFTKRIFDILERLPHRRFVKPADHTLGLFD